MAALCTTQSFNPRADLPVSTSSSPHLNTVLAHTRAKRRHPLFPFPPIYPLGGIGERASFNKRLIIHPDLNNRHSPTIVSFPYENPWLKIVCAVITCIYVRAIISIYCVAYLFDKWNFSRVDVCFCYYV